MIEKVGYKHYQYSKELQQKKAGNALMEELIDRTKRHPFSAFHSAAIHDQIEVEESNRDVSLKRNYIDNGRYQRQQNQATDGYHEVNLGEIEAGAVDHLSDLKKLSSYNIALKRLVKCNRKQNEKLEYVAAY